MAARWLAVVLMLLATGPAWAGDTVDRIRAHGAVKCGVHGDQPGFATHDPAHGWQGLAIDLCRAVAAAVLADGDAIEVVRLPPGRHFPTIAGGAVDLALAGHTWTLARDAAMGLTFPAIVLYDAVGFRAHQHVDPDGPATVCVTAGTTTARRVAAHLASGARPWRLVEHARTRPMFDAFATGACDIIAAEERSLATLPAGETIRLPDRQTPEPLSLVTAEGDAAWADLLHWLVNVLLAAEAAGISKDDVHRHQGDPAFKGLMGDQAAPARALGVAPGWGYRVLATVGHYGEIFARHLAPLGLDRGLNALRRDGGLRRPLPMP